MPQLKLKDLSGKLSKTVLDMFVMLSVYLEASLPGYSISVQGGSTKKKRPGKKQRMKQALKKKGLLVKEKELAKKRKREAKLARRLERRQKRRQAQKKQRADNALIKQVSALNKKLAVYEPQVIVPELPRSICGLCLFGTMRMMGTGIGKVTHAKNLFCYKGVDSSYSLLATKGIDLCVKGYKPRFISLKDILKDVFFYSMIPSYEWISEKVEGVFLILVNNLKRLGFGRDMTSEEAFGTIMHGLTQFQRSLRRENVPRFSGLRCPFIVAALYSSKGNVGLPVPLIKEKESPKVEVRVQEDPSKSEKFQVGLGGAAIRNFLSTYGMHFEVRKPIEKFLGVKELVTQAPEVIIITPIEEPKKAVNPVLSNVSPPKKEETIPPPEKEKKKRVKHTRDLVKSPLIVCKYCNEEKYAEVVGSRFCGYCKRYNPEW